jgi:DNA-binding transcriptional ArsR family regulator
MQAEKRAEKRRHQVFMTKLDDGSATGPEGMPAGEIASALKLAPSALTFHFDRLRMAGLVTVRRDGRSMIYAARFERMNALLGYLTENCCKGAPDACAPVVCTPARSKRAKVAVS